jgi:transcription antitermination protein NusB
MQTLYSLSRDSGIDAPIALQQYRKKISLSLELYFFVIYFFKKIIDQVFIEYDHRKSKFIPSESDKTFSPKLGDNALFKSLETNIFFLRYFNRLGFPQRIPAEISKLIYLDFETNSQTYQNYLMQNDASNEAHLELMLHLFKFLCGNENFEEKIEDYFPNWTDDKSLIIGVVKKTLKALPFEDDYSENLKPDPEATVDFGEGLLLYVIQNEEALKSLITPILQNWDIERVAVIDMILLKMALAELLNFTSIPPKVTLNEYVEISKLYSTEKSKEFINGILDRLLKKLQKDGLIKKEGRGLID